MPKKVLDELDARALPVSLREAAKQQFDVSFEKAHSMRCITFLAVCLTVSSMAQNWTLINPAYRYNYSDDGTDTISNQIFVTHIDTLGVDSFRYELNKIGVVCSACSDGYSCGGWSGPVTDMVHAGRSQGTGSTVRRSGSSWFVERNSDTLLFLPNEPLGASWNGPGNVSVTVFAMTESTVLGTTDSLKHIAFSTGDTIVITKGHGIQTIRNGLSGDDPLMLVGVGGVISDGIQYPSVLDLFNYGIGDVLQYHDEAQFQSSFCVHFVEGTTKYRVLDRVDSVGVTTYSMEHIFTWYEESFDPSQWWAPCGTDHDQGSEIVSLVVDHEQFTDANMFGSGLQGSIYPHALDSVSPLPDYPPYERTLILASLDSSHRVVIEPFMVDPGGGNATLFCPSDQDAQELLSLSDGIFEFTYCEGIGLIYYNYFSFESGNSRQLVGYEINGVQVGTITPDGAILEITTIAVGPILEVVPNLVSEQLTFQVRVPTSGIWRIVSPNGQVCRTGSMQKEQRRTIDVSGIPIGVYLLELSTPTGRSSKRFVVVR